MTYQEIGDMFGVTRQRIHQIMNGYKSCVGRNYHTSARTDWFRSNYISMKNPTTGKQQAIRVSGKRPRPYENCELCDRANERLVYHHWNDNNYGHGLWLCYRCHHFVHGIDDGYITAGYHNKYTQLRDSISNLT